MNNTLHWRDLGFSPYSSVWQAMRDFTEGRSVDTPDELWFVQHPPVFTLGRAGKPEHVLAPGDIPVLQSDRGGQVTYHGPGQLVAYVLVDMQRRQLGIRRLVSALEGSVVALLADYGVASAPRPDAPGVYVDGAKIAALGLRVRHGRSYHGIALNCEMDLEPYSRINPCGYAGQRVTQLCDLVPAVDLERVKTAWLAQIVQALGYTHATSNELELV